MGEWAWVGVLGVGGRSPVHSQSKPVQQNPPATNGRSAMLHHASSSVCAHGGWLMSYADTYLCLSGSLGCVLVLVRFDRRYALGSSVSFRGEGWEGAVRFEIVSDS